MRCNEGYFNTLYLSELPPQSHNRECYYLSFSHAIFEQILGNIINNKPVTVFITVFTICPLIYAFSL